MFPGPSLLRHSPSAVPRIVHHHLGGEHPPKHAERLLQHPVVHSGVKALRGWGAERGWAALWKSGGGGCTTRVHMRDMPHLQAPRWRQLLPHSCRSIKLGHGSRHQRQPLEERAVCGSAAAAKTWPARDGSLPSPRYLGKGLEGGGGVGPRAGGPQRPLTRTNRLPWPAILLRGTRTLSMTRMLLPWSMK